MVLSASQMVALREMRALLVWVLLQLKIISRGEVCAPPPLGAGRKHTHHIKC